MSAPHPSYGSQVPQGGYQPQQAPYQPGPYQQQPGYQQNVPYQQQGYYPPQQGPVPGGYAQPHAYPTNSGQNQGQVSEKAPWDPSQATPYSGPDMATEDLDENQQLPESQIVSAPSYDLVVSGYENVGSAKEEPVGPPPPYEPPQMEAAVVDTSTMPAISDEQARDALLQFVAQNACWGSGAAKQMEIKNMTPTNAYHYTLETYTEGRSTKFTHTPFKGGYVDGPENGPAPMPWDIPCNCTALFKTETHKIPVPHTDMVKTCHRCFGRGFNRCSRCWGRGNVRCTMCHGSGHRRTVDADGRHHHSSCMHCHGRGRKRCMCCHGSGCVLCSECAGYGSLKQFIQLTVNFVNQLSDHIVEKTDLPDELIRNVQGSVLFEQTHAMVRPIENFFESEINQQSAALVAAHSQSWPHQRILQQRQILRSVPVHECHFEHNGKLGRFWVYGHQHKVYTEDYPHTCCCCRCVIL